MKKNFKHRVFALLVAIACVTTSSAQWKLPKDIPTPNAASLGKYGDIPVSYFTGRANVSIPLYELKVRDFTLPITLDYDAGGVLPNSLPSWVGQNWTLNVGGVIIRTVKGRYDEWIYPRQTNLTWAKNYYQSLDMLPKLLADGTDDYKALRENVEMGRNDLAPDIFSFSFLGRTGKFFLGADGNWKVESEDNLEVLFDYTNANNFISPFIEKYPYKQASDNNQRKTIKGFTIRDEQGYTYEFGMNINAIDFSTDFWHMSEYEENESWHAMSWYLTKVRDKFGNDLVTLNYERGCYVLQACNSYAYSRVEEDASWGAHGHYGQTYVDTNSFFPYTFTISSPSYLVSITGSNGIQIRLESDPAKGLATEKIFRAVRNGDSAEGFYQKMAKIIYKNSKESYEPGAFFYLQTTDVELAKFKFKPQEENRFDFMRYARTRQLNKIVIATNPTLKMNSKISSATLGYRFHFSYPKNRMMLDSVSIQNTAINYTNTVGIKGRYRFSYNDTARLEPDYVTKAIDHWGYYNGREYSNPTLTKGFETFGQIRNPNFEYAQIGSLRQIQYPTGGVSVLEYEPNAFSQYLSDDRQSMVHATGMGGGLRIKSITEYDSPSCDKMLKRRTFEYNIPGTNTSSGELFAYPKYYWPQWSALCIDQDAHAQHKLETFHAASIIPLSNSFGPSLGYTYVTEKTMELTDTTKHIGKVVYHYSNLSDPNTRDEKFTLTFSDGNPSPEDEFSEWGFKRGKLIGETYYDANDKKVKSTGYTYRQDDMSKQYVLTSNLGYNNNGNSASFSFYGGGVYKLYYPKYDLVASCDTVFSSGISAVTSTTYCKSDKVMASGYSYAHQVDLRLLDAKIVRRNNGSLETEYSYGDFSGNSLAGKMYKQMFSLEPLAVATYRNGALVSKQSTELQSVVCNGRTCYVPKFATMTYPSSKQDTLVSYLGYTSTGRLSSYKELGKPASYMVWGFGDNYLLMIGGQMLKGVKMQDADVLDEDKCLQRELGYIIPYGHIKGYVYHPFLGVIDIIGENGYVTKYKYDDIGRLQEIYDNDNKRIYRYDYHYYDEK